MKGRERSIITGAVVLILAVGFYMLVVSPKRAELSELDDEITALEASVSEQEQLASFGEQARKQFPRDYGKLVVLGKAVPEQADTASLLVQLNGMAGPADVDFRGIALNQAAAGTGTTTSTTPAAPAAPTTGEAAPGATSTDSETSAEPAAAPAEGAAAPAAAPTAAPATEAAAANLPIGAVVGPAGLPTLPYDLSFQGGFFGIADYLGELDSLVRTGDDGSKVRVSGRLMTVDGFALAGGDPGSDPTLDATFLLTTYVTPSEQGLTAGATPGGPTPSGTLQPAPTPASTTVAP